LIDYFATFAYTNGLAFPNTLAINASGPGATDGTEFIKAFIDDLWGARQAVMDAAGLSPSGVTEGPGASQFLEALRLLGPGPAVVTEWHGAADPSVTGHRALPLNGQGILRANYVELDTLVYVGDGLNPTATAYYHADDAAGTIRNIAGVYLILPESRGYAPRGLDTAATVDPQGASRDLGSLQADAMQRITGSFGTNLHAAAGVSMIVGQAGVFTVGPATNAASPGSFLGASLAAEGALFDNSNSVAPNAAKTDDVETRMANRATNYVLWW